MSNKKIRVVWICHFSNKDIRNNVQLVKYYGVNIIRKLFGSPLAGVVDYAVWNTNAVKEIVRYDDLDISIIMPYYGLSGKLQQFELEGIHYYCYRSQDDHILPFVKSKILKKFERKYKNNRYLISQLIKKIAPDIVHVIGAENPYYSIAALDISQDIPSIVSLQTLLSDPQFKSRYKLLNETFDYRAELERLVILKCKYIATGVPSFMEYIKGHIKPEAVFLNMPLAVGVDIISSECAKVYDFVYFAANINKACDIAIEAFGILCQKFPRVTLNVSGSYDASYKKMIDERISELGITENVIFTGGQKTHEDVINQIRKSRFALLPLKVDIVSSTIREAMACGLPVVTTVTDGTPKLNEQRESVLLSEQKDFNAMAFNMQKLLENSIFAETIRNNAFETVREKWSNERLVSTWHDAYLKISNNDI